MAKHINVDELFTKLDMIGNPDSEFATDDYIDGFSDGVSAAMKVVEEATPTADVVEVVRCMDCKYYKVEITDPFGGINSQLHLCMKNYPYKTVMVNRYDFCSRAERKENRNDH